MVERGRFLGLLLYLGIVNCESQINNRFPVRPNRFQPSPQFFAQNNMAQGTQQPIQQQIMADQQRASFINNMPINSGPPQPNFFNHPNARSPFSNPNLQVSQLVPAAIVPQQLPVMQPIQSAVPQPSQRQFSPSFIGPTPMNNNFGSYNQGSMGMGMAMNDPTPGLGMMGQYGGGGLGGNPYQQGGNPYGGGGDLFGGGLGGSSQWPGSMGGSGNWGTNQQQRCVCTTEYFPVCGTDGKDYTNLCSLECVAKNNPSLNLVVAYRGKCATTATGDVGWNTYASSTYLPVDPCAWRCYGGEKTVCDLTGKRYRNECQYWVAHCRSTKAGTVLSPLAPTCTGISTIEPGGGIILRSLDGEDPYQSPVA